MDIKVTCICCIILFKNTSCTSVLINKGKSCNGIQFDLKLNIQYIYFFYWWLTLANPIFSDGNHTYMYTYQYSPRQPTVSQLESSSREAEKKRNTATGPSCVSQNYQKPSFINNRFTCTIPRGKISKHLQPSKKVREKLAHYCCLNHS